MSGSGHEKEKWKQGKEDDEVIKFSEPELVKITNSFSKLKGKGNSSAIVYEGRYGESQVAVKMCSDKKEWKIEKDVLIDLLYHPNIISLIGYNEDRNALVMEYMPHNLETILKGTKLTWSQILEILKQLASALEYAVEKKEYVIGDVKPDNILVDETCSVIKLCDFASARKNGIGVPTKNESYLPPELINKDKGYITSDVFSYGTILLQMITKTNDENIGKVVMNNMDLNKQRKAYGLLTNKKKPYDKSHISAKARVDMESKKHVVHWELIGHCKGDAAMKITDLGIECTNQDFKKRPEISKVVTRINNIL